MSKSDRLLRKSLATNGFFSIVTGAVGAIFSSSISEFMGVNQVVLVIVGVGVFLFGVGILMDARRPELNLVQARLTVIADVVWVVAAAVLVVVFADLMTTGGNTLLALISVPVAIFAVMQWLGLRRAGSEFTEVLLAS